MNPGPTFDRVYVALREQLLDGRHPPGEHLEPAALGEELSSSITPVRDALHRLVGERLLEAPRNDGFRVPFITEAGLRNLYGWSGDLLRLALAHPRTPLLGGGGSDAPRDGAPPSEAAADLFVKIVRASGNPEHLRALSSALDRLSPLRRLEEGVLAKVQEELEELVQATRAHELAALRRAIASYHRRRIKVAPQLLAALQARF